MEIIVAFLAEAADIHSSKFCVIGGGLDLLIASEFPAVSEPMVLIAKVGLPPGETTLSGTLACDVVDSAGRSLTIAPMAASDETATYDEEHSYGHPGGIRILARLGIPSLTFPQAGTYTFEILWGDQSIWTIPFHVTAQRATPDELQ